MAHKVYNDTVLGTGPGANFIKRPKLVAIVKAFENEGGRTVEQGLKIASESLPDMKSKHTDTEENKQKYLRSYLSQLINAEALSILNPGTAPAPVAAPAAEGEEAKPKRARGKKKAEAAEPATPVEGDEAPVDTTDAELPADAGSPEENAEINGDTPSEE